MGMIKLPPQSINYFKNNIDQIFQSGNLAEGPWAEKLSEKIKLITKVKYAVPTCSNGSGIVGLLQIYKEHYNRKSVLIQSNTMYGVKTMVKSGGCELAGYIQCRLETLMPAFDDVERAVNDYEGNNGELIILLSDIGGIINPDEEKISAYCRDHNIILIEDCAHSLGATLNGKHAGTFGDAGVYSFYATKAIFAGEGGIVVTNNSEIGDLIKRFTIYDRFDQKLDIGINIRPSEVQSLMIYSVVMEIENIILNKSVIAKEYIDVCNTLKIPFINQDTEMHKGNYYKFVIFSKNNDINEYLPSLTTVTSNVYDYALGDSKGIRQKHACLPIWYGQDIEVTEKVLSELKSCF